MYFSQLGDNLKTINLRQFRYKIKTTESCESIIFEKIVDITVGDKIWQSTHILQQSMTKSIMLFVRFFLDRMPVSTSSMQKHIINDLVIPTNFTR